MNWIRRHRLMTALVAGLFIIGVIAHFCLHAFLVRFVNRKLNTIPDYSAHIDDIGVHLWRGAYSIEGLKVLKREGRSVAPFFQARDIDISLQWKELFHRHIVAKVIMTEPQITVVTSKNKAVEQSVQGGGWQEQVQSLVPIKLNYFKIVDGSVHWRDPFSDPPMDIFLHELNMTAYNLTNSSRLSTKLASTIVGDGVIMKDGRLHLDATTDPYEKLPTFKSEW